MATDISPQNEQFLSHVVERGVFHNRAEALDQAVELLRRRQEFLDHIDEGTRQVRSGEGIELQGEAALTTFFESIHAEGMHRYNERKTAR